jgi:hypothetical protein
MTLVGRMSVFLLDVYDVCDSRTPLLPAAVLGAILLAALSFIFPGLRVAFLTALILLLIFFILVYLNYWYLSHQTTALGPDDATDTARQAVVSTGFSLPQTPGVPIGKRKTLACTTDHLYWVEIGAPVGGSIELKPTALPPLPEKAALTVTLAGFSDGLITVPGADIGELEMQPDGSARVLRQPLEPTEPISQSGLQDRRLFFPVRTPPDPGTYRMRCNIYHGQVLVQSREIQARVTPVSETVTQGPQALRSVLDYNLSASLDGAQLSPMGEHRLSILLNESGSGSHSLHLFGTDGKEKWKNDDLRFQEGELDDLVETARKKLRLASWESEGEWQKGKAYRYAKKETDSARLKVDLHRMAWWGSDFYGLLKLRMAGHEEKLKAFEEALAAPGLIQLAMKESAQSIIPLAMVYDYPMDADTEEENFQICPTFKEALEKEIPMQDTACFRGHCPSRGDRKKICPSGFWGFRHAVGMPISVRWGMDAPSTIPVKGKLRIAMVVSTTLGLVGDHVAKVQKIREDAEWSCAAVRDKVLEELKNRPHLVYFYCHGCSDGTYPYLQIGTTVKPENIYRKDFYDPDVAWRDPRPLVFINGCHTTDVAPLKAFSLSEPVVVNAHGAGVIGTEISVFEPLAADFAEECLRLFLKGDSIGWAIRNARLKILADGNPLGLAYIPFAVAGLQLEPVGGP